MKKLTQYLIGVVLISLSGMALALPYGPPYGFPYGEYECSWGIAPQGVSLSSPSGMTKQLILHGLEVNGVAIVSGKIIQTNPVGISVCYPEGFCTSSTPETLVHGVLNATAVRTTAGDRVFFGDVTVGGYRTQISINADNGYRGRLWVNDPDAPFGHIVLTDFYGCV